MRIELSRRVFQPAFRGGDPVTRVQQLADAEEIFVSEDVYSAEGVQALLVSREVASDVFRLKGVRQDLRVFRIPKDLTAS